MLRFKHFVRGKKFDFLQTVYIPVECQSWHQLLINLCSFAGMDLEVNGWRLSDQLNVRRTISVVHVVQLATQLLNIKLSFLACFRLDFLRLQEVFYA